MESVTEVDMRDSDGNYMITQLHLSICCDRKFADTITGMNDWNAQIIAEFRASGGKAAQFGDNPLVILHTIGAKSGEVREIPLVTLGRGRRPLRLRLEGRCSDEPRLVLQPQGQPGDHRRVRHRDVHRNRHRTPRGRGSGQAARPGRVDAPVRRVHHLGGPAGSSRAFQASPARPDRASTPSDQRARRRSQPVGGLGSLRARQHPLAKTGRQLGAGGDVVDQLERQSRDCGPARSRRAPRRAPRRTTTGPSHTSRQGSSRTSPHRRSSRSTVRNPSALRQSLPVHRPMSAAFDVAIRVPPQSME